MAKANTGRPGAQGRATEGQLYGGQSSFGRDSRSDGPEGSPMGWGLDPGARNAVKSYRG